MNTVNIGHSFAKYVSLNVIGMIGLSCYILADTFFIAQGIGPDGLTALNLAIPIYSFIQGTGLMLGMGGATRFAISKSKTVFTQAVYCICFATVLFWVAGLFFSNQIVMLLGADSATLAYASTYLQMILCFSPMFLLNNVVICFARNDGSPKLAMSAMLIGSFSNIILDYIFIFPYKMGMFGAALATGIAPVISLLVLSGHFIKKKNTFHLLKKRPALKEQLDLMRLGVSALITECSSGVVIIVFNVIILGLEGNTGVAAYGVIANIALIVVAVFTGIAQGMQPLISFCHREEQQNNVRTVVKYGFMTAILVSVLVYVVSAVFAGHIVAAFNKDGNPQLAQIAVNGLRIYFTAFAFAGVNILCAAHFSAVGKSKNAFIISVLRGFLVIVPVAFLLSALFGINGVWIAMTVSEFAVLLFAASRMLQAKRSMCAAGSPNDIALQEKELTI